QILSRAPSAVAARQPRIALSGVRPQPWMATDALSKLSQLLHQRMARSHRKRRGDPDMMKDATVVVQPKQQGADRGPRRPMPAEAGHDAFGRADVLDLYHHALAWLIRQRLRFGDDAVETGAFELTQPRPCRGGVAGARRQKYGRHDSGKRALER